MMETAHAAMLDTETVPIDSVQPHPDNARRGNVARIERSLRDHGQYAPLIVHQSTGHILKGNNTWRVMRDRLGLTHATVTWVQCSDAQARAILATDNRSSDDAGYDSADLLALLEKVAEDGYLGTAGFEQADIDDLVAALEEASDLPPLAEPYDPPTPQRYMADGDTAEPDARERASVYEASTTRAVVLTLAGEAYVEFAKNLETISDRLHLDTNTDAIVRAVELAVRCLKEHD